MEGEGGPAVVLDGCVAGQDPVVGVLELRELAMDGDWIEREILAAFFLYILCLLGG